MLRKNRLKNRIICYRSWKMLTKQQKTYKINTNPLWLLPMLLLAGCASNSTELKPCPQMVIPPLSASARAQQPIELCSVSCLSSLTDWRELTQQKLTEIE